METEIATDQQASRQRSIIMWNWKEHKLEAVCVAGD